MNHPYRTRRWVTPLLAVTLVASLGLHVLTADAASASGEPGTEATTNTDQGYVVQPGDTLYSIARTFRVRMGDLLAANPQLTNPNVLVAGDSLLIPNDNPSPLDPQITVTPSVLQQAGSTPVRVQGRNWIGQLGGEPIGISACPAGTTDLLAQACTALVTLDPAETFDVTVQADVPGAGIVLIVDQFRGFSDPEVLVQVLATINVSGRVESPYAVRPGDTLAGIAATAGISLDQVLTWNPAITNPNTLAVGQLVNLVRPPSTPPPVLNDVYIVQPGDTMLGIARQRGMTLAELLAWNPALDDPDRIAPGDPVRTRG